MEFAHLTWKEAQSAVERNAGIILTVASTEQHGPHLPLATDTLLGHDLAMAVAEGMDLLVAPVLPYGYRSRPLSGGGQRFVGTTSLRGATLIAVVTDVLREFVRHGFRRIVLLAHHMENQNFLYEAAFETVGAGPASADGARIMVIESPIDLSVETLEFVYGDDFPGWALEHASVLETSLMLHLHPELVRMDELVDDRVTRELPYDVLPIPDGLVPASGVLSGSRRATAEKGDRAWSEIVERLQRQIRTEMFGA